MIDVEADEQDTLINLLENLTFLRRLAHTPKKKDTDDNTAACLNPIGSDFGVANAEVLLIYSPLQNGTNGRLIYSSNTKE